MRQLYFHLAWLVSLAWRGATGEIYADLHALATAVIIVNFGGAACAAMLRFFLGMDRCNR